MPYGEIRVDTITFTNGGVDKSITVSGLFASTSGNLTVTGTVSGVTATFATGTFSSRVSGLTVVGTTGTFTSLTGTTITGANASFVSGVFTNQVSGATVTGTTANFTSGNITTFSGGTCTVTSGVFASGTATNPSISFVGDSNTGFYSPGADQVAITTSGAGRLFVDSTGRVGIGTSSPSEPLSISASSNAFISITNSTAAKTNYIGTNSSGDLDLNGNGSQIILFKTAGTERLRIDSSGRLLVGTSTARANFDNSSESAVLQIEGTTNQSRRAAIISSIADVAGGNLTLAHQRSGTIGGNTILQDADTTGAITFQGSDGTEFVPAGSIACQVDGIPGANDMPGRLVFSTTADGASSPTERMRIKNNGLVCIACTDRIDAATNASGFNYLPGDFVCVATTVSANACAIFNKTNSAAGLVIAIRYNGVDVGSITNTSTSTAYNTSSDYRLKENVVPLTGAIDRINQLKPSQFNFIADPDRIVDGFLAHEAQEVVPECVTGEKDAVDDEGNPIYQGIDQSKMVPLAIAAIQEAIAKIETLEAKVAALEGV